MSPFIYALAAVGAVAIMAFPFLVWERKHFIDSLRKIEENSSKKVVPAWQWFQTELISKLTPSTPRAKELLQLLKDNPECPMTDSDRRELLEGLAIDDPKATLISQQVQHILPVVMEQVQVEAASPQPITQVQLVGTKPS